LFRHHPPPGCQNLKNEPDKHRQVVEKWLTSFALSSNLSLGQAAARHLPAASWRLLLGSAQALRLRRIVLPEPHFDTLSGHRYLHMEEKKATFCTSPEGGTHE